MAFLPVAEKRNPFESMRAMADTILTANLNLYHVTKFFPLIFVNCLLPQLKKISSFTPVLYIRIVLDSLICLFSILRNSQLECDVSLLA